MYDCRKVGNIELVEEDTIVLMATNGSEQKRLDTIQFSTTDILYTPGEVYDNHSDSKVIATFE